MGLDLCEFIHEVNEYVLKTSCVPDLVLGYEGKVVNKVDRHISFWNMIEKHETDSHILISGKSCKVKVLCKGLLGESNQVWEMREHFPEELKLKPKSGR